MKSHRVTIQMKPLVEFLQSTILFMYFCTLVTIWSEKVINSF